MVGRKRVGRDSENITYKISKEQEIRESHYCPPSEETRYIEAYQIYLTRPGHVNATEGVRKTSRNLQKEFV